MMTLTAYAKRRGCSVKSVSRAVAAGRVVDSVGRDEYDRPTIVDAELADREWEANTRGRTAPRPLGREPAVERTPADSEAESPPAARASRALPEGVPAYNVSQAIRAQAAARREAAQADLAELELQERRGLLVDATAARADVEEAYTLVKTRLLRVPSAVAQQMPDLAIRVVPVIESLISDALEELALG